MSNSKNQWTRQNYGAGIGIGRFYADGTEVRVGDLIELPMTEKPGTIRIRNANAQGQRMNPYITYWENQKGHHVKVGDIVEWKRYEKKRFGNNIPIKAAPKPVVEYRPTKGRVILGLLDYDHAIEVVI